MKHSGTKGSEPRSTTVASSGTADSAGRLLSAVGDHEVDVALLVELFEQINSTLELDSMLRTVAERIRPIVGYDAFGVLLLDPLGRELRFRFGSGYGDEVLRHWRFGLGQGIVGVAAQLGQPVRVDDVLQDPRYIAGRDDIRSELAIPLIAKSRTVGVLDVQSRQPSAFTREHQRLLSFVAGHLAHAIENGRLYENLRDQARSLTLLNEVGRELTSILDLDTLFNKVAEMVKRLVNYHVFSVMLWNEERQLLEHAYSLKFDERFCQKTDFPLGYGITGTVAARRQSLRVPNVHLDPRYVRCGHQVEVRSELVVPLVFKDRLIGVIDLESTEYDAFSERHEEMLSTLGSYIAVAIENARLYECVREDERRLAEELTTAREIQQGLLPLRAPEVPGLDVAYGYEPAKSLGGDIYDFLPYGDGRLAVMVGDVVGKATAAALQGSLAVGILRGRVVERPSPPAEMLELMNRHLLHPTLENRYVAMLFCVYDAGDRSLELANAGFTRPLLLREGRVKEIPIQGIPVGLMEHSRYESQRIALRPGDLVALCSDGIHECRSPGGEEFGRRRVGQLVASLADRSASQIARGLLEATDRFLGEVADPDDDRTVVILKARA